MKLTILTGRPDSGCRERVYQDAAEYLKQGGQALILVPEQFGLEAENLLIDAMGGDGFFGVPVMSPTRLTREVFDRMDRVRPETVDERGRAMAVLRAASGLQNELPLLGAALRRPRFAAEVAELLGDMKRFDVTPGKLMEAGQNANKLLKGKTFEIARLAEAYDGLLASRGLWDTESRFNALIEAIPSADWLKDTRIWIDGFDQYPPQWKRLIVVLVRQAAEVTVTLTVAEDNAPDREIFLTGERDLETLEALLRTEGIPFEREHLENKPISGPAQLSRKLFAYPIPQAEDIPGICLKKAPDVETEFEAVAAGVEQLVRSGSRYRDIRIACTDLQQQQRRLLRIFERSGIPAFTDDRFALLEHPLPGLVLAALEVTSRGWRRDDVMRLAKNPLIPLSRDEIEQFEIYCTALDIEGRRRLQRPFTMSVDHVRTDMAESARRKLVEPLDALMKGAVSKSPEAWQELLKDLLEKWNIPDGLEDYSELCRQLDERSEQARTAQVYEELNDLLRQMVYMLPETPLSPTEFSSLLEAGFAAAKMGILPTRGDAVLVGDIGRTKVSSSDTLFIVGAQEGLLPCPHGEGAIFHDRDLAYLNDAGLPLGRDGQIRSAQSRLSVVEALACVKREVRMLYAQTNEAGETLLPSVALLRTAQLIGEDPGDIEEVSPWDTRNLRSLMAITAREIGKAGRGRAAEGPVRSALASVIATEEGAAWYAMLTRKTAEEPVGPQNVNSLSVSKLEEYGKCPLAWFVKYRLAPAEWPRMAADARNVGTYVHAVMENLVKDPQALTSEDAAAQRSAELADELRAEQFGDSKGDTALGDYYFERMKETCMRTGRAVARQFLAGSFHPAGTEEQLDHSARIDLEDGTALHLSGIVDRVDMTDGPEPWLRIIDYKTGAKEMELGGIEDGTQLQLWIYLGAMLGKSNARPAGVFYEKARDPLSDKDPIEEDRPFGAVTDDPEVRRAMDRNADEKGNSAVFDLSSNKMDEKLMRAACDMAKATAARLGLAMRRGEVDARPVGNVCDYCEYKLMCGQYTTPPHPGKKGKKGEVKKKLKGEDIHA